MNAGMRDGIPGITFVKDTDTFIEQQKPARLLTGSQHLRRSQKVCPEVDTVDTNHDPTVIV